jgi:hypothetical protein
MSDRKQQLDEALEALRERDIDPQSAGGATALGFLLGSGEAAQASPVAAPASTQPPATGASAGGDDPIANLSAWSGIDAVRLRDFFEFSDGIRLTIPSGRLPKSKANKQRILTLLTLAADRMGNGNPRTGWSQVNAVVGDYAVLDQNLGNNVAKNSSMIIRSGKPKTYVYRITQPGLDEARGLLQSLAAGEGMLGS